ncbi:MAG: hypothetical protein QM820_24170 [Minicystis sp.]
MIEVPGKGPVAIDWSRTRWEPAITLLDTRRAAAVRERVIAEGIPHIPVGGRIRERCVREGDPIFVEGCEHYDIGPSVTRTVGACADAPLVITPGDGTARSRIAELSASLAGRASLLGAAAMLVLLYLWRLCGARAFADAIGRRVRRPQLPLVEPVALVLAPFFVPGALALALYAPRFSTNPAVVDRYGFVGACFVAMASLVAAVRMIDRRRALGALDAVVRAAAAKPLDRARGGEALALDAEIDPGAPKSSAPLAGKPHAHWLVSATRVFKSGSNHSSEPAGEQRGPMLVPLRSEHGAAILDLTHATVDLRARLLRVRGRRLRAHLARLLAGAPEPSSIYVFEERFLDPGEPVHVIGRVQRFENVSGRAVPVIGGVPGDVAIVHAGTRRSLLRGLAVERGYLAVAAPIGLGISVAVAALSAYLASR